FGLCTHAPQSGALGHDDTAQAVGGGGQVDVDDDEVVLDVRGDFLPGDFESTLNRLLAVLASTAQESLERVGGGRHQENCRVLDAARADLPRALHVDHEHDVLARSQQP